MSRTIDAANKMRNGDLEALLDKVWEPPEEILTSFYKEIQRLIKLVEGSTFVLTSPKSILNPDK